MATGRNNPKDHPKTTQIAANMLKEMGITDYEPRVLNHLTEFAHRYTTEILKDASIYSKYAKKKIIDEEDVSLAIKMKQERTFTSPPSKDLNVEVAQARNATPLPVPKTSVGPRLPADRYAVTATNYRLKSVAKKKVVANIPRLSMVGSSTISIGQKKGAAISFLRTNQPASPKPGALPILPMSRPFVTVAKPAMTPRTEGLPTTSASVFVSPACPVVDMSPKSTVQLLPVVGALITDTKLSSEVPNEAKPAVSEE